jgi:hypothetical protein
VGQASAKREQRGGSTRAEPKTMTARAMADRLRPWVDDALPALLGDADPATADVCLSSLRRVCDDDLLVKKVESELGAAPWAPLGRVLVVVSENDVLGTAFALLGALVTGNQVRVKARHTRDLVESLVAALGAAVEVDDWQGHAQDDDALLADIDAVLVAGGDEVIRRYRRAAPAHVRLIEWGPAVSAAAVGADADPADRAMLDRLVADVTLFGQRVCSSPQLIAVDPGVAGPLFARIRDRLAELPRLSDDERLAQHARACQLELLGRLDGRVRVALERRTGWGVTTSASIEPALRLHRGFALVVGPVSSTLGDLARRHRRRLQTLGTWGAPPPRAGFTRVCPIGAMHARSPLEPHDGVFELTRLVDFLS